MDLLGKVRIGKKAPDFRCDAVHKGKIEEVTLSTYINKDKKAWLILLFIPAAFSFVCPTEVLAFQNCLDEFKDRNCDVVFISVDTKHSLWHWQNVPRQYGGLGSVDVSLLSDATHKMSRDYGVLIEEEGVCLRGMFILDEETIVQQVTLNNLTVGRSVLEALRLLEAFQAVAKHGVLCPVDWKPSGDTMDIAATISSTLTESYDDRLSNLQKAFGDVLVTDLDLKQRQDAEKKERNASEGNVKGSRRSSNAASTRTRSSASSIRKMTTTPQMSRKSSLNIDHSPVEATKEGKDGRELRKTSSNDSPPSAKANVTPARSRWPSFKSDKSASAPSSMAITPLPTPTPQEAPKLLRGHSQTTTARHARGHCHTPKPPTKVPSPSSPQTPYLGGSLTSYNTYESATGSQVILEFAEPSSSPFNSPLATPGSVVVDSISYAPWLSGPLVSVSSNSTPSTPRAPSLVGSGGRTVGTPAGEQTPTRLQARFEAIRRISAGLMSPGLKRVGGEGEGGSGSGGSSGKGGSRSGSRSGEAQKRGYFDIFSDAAEVFGPVGGR